MEEPLHFLEQPQVAMEGQAEEQQDLRELFLERQRLLQHPVVAEGVQRWRDSLAERDAELAAARQELAATKGELRQAKVYLAVAADPVALHHARQNRALTEEAEGLRFQVAELRRTLGLVRADLETARLQVEQRTSGGSVAGDESGGGSGSESTASSSGESSNGGATSCSVKTGLCQPTRTPRWCK